MLSFIFLFTLGGSNLKIHCISHRKGGRKISRTDRTRGGGGVWQKSRVSQGGKGGSPGVPYSLARYLNAPLGGRWGGLVGQSMINDLNMCISLLVSFNLC